ncbi:MAG: polysaccharide deacetylase family protein, partial [Longimicrobiales bacterium]|nr:polysaccharide deacetylase family protein [Longimicrobiales bacterium]
MRPRRDPVPRAREAWWWLGGLLTLGLVAAGVVAAGVALWENIDMRQLAPALQAPPPPPPTPELPPPPARMAASFDVALFDSERNRAYFPDADFHPAQMRRWRSLAEQAGGVVRTVSDAAGLRGLAPDEVLLIPESPCLSAGERGAVEDHLERGGSLVTNWALGVRDGSCSWRGWDMLLTVTGAEAVRELTGRPALYLTVPAGLATSPGLDPGTRVEVRPDPAVALRMPGARIYWSDWALNPWPDDDGAGADVAVSTTRSGAGGRVSWFGVRTGQAVSDREQALLERVFHNGIRWAAGAPHAAPTPWPEAARTALLFAIEVEGEAAYRNAADIASAFQADDLPISFFAVSRLVEGDEALAEALSAAGEVGTQTVDHTPLAGLTAQDQRIRLRRSWSDIEEWTGLGPAGLRPPEESVDAVTLEAWRRAGGRYILASNEARSASPEIHDVDGGPMVLLPRLMKDDYTIIVRDITLRSRTLAEAYLAGTKKIRAIGGLAVVAGHTQIIEPGARLQALRSVADSVRGHDVWWIAEARDVALGWVDRARVTLAWAPRGAPEAE